MSLDIYREAILDHYKYPHNRGHIKNPDVKIHDSNPLCGDSFTFELKIDNKQIKDVKFSGEGCAISTASASMLSERIKGLALEKIKNLDKDDILKMLDIELGHMRIKCAMLPLKIVKLAIYKFINKKEK